MTTGEDAGLAAGRERLRRARWNWFGVLVLGVVLMVAAAMSEAAVFLGFVGFGLFVLAGFKWPMKKNYVR